MKENLIMLKKIQVILDLRVGHSFYEIEATFHPLIRSRTGFERILLAPPCRLIS